MNTRSTNDDLPELFEEVLSERAGEEAFRRLENLLETNERVRDEFALYAQLHVDLRYCFRTDAVDQEKRVDAQGQIAPVRSRRQTTTRRVSRRSVAWLIGYAAALFVAAWAAHVSLTPSPDNASSAVVLSRLRPPAPVATLTTHENAMWAGSQLVDGQTLREGEQIHLISGEARISMGVGAEISARGPCALRLVAPDRVQLEFGDVVVYVAEWAKGFTVVTDTMEVIDLGTTFTVSASADAGAEAGVLKGQVRVNPRKAADEGPRTVLVSEGESLFVDPQGHRMSRQLEMLENGTTLSLSDLQPYRPVALYNTGIGFAIGDEDPNWRVIAGPEGEFSAPVFAMVCEPDVRYLANEAKLSQWISMPNWRAARANSTYTFETTFDLTGYDLDTIQLFGRFLADNGIQEVRVNGRPVILESWIDNVAGQSFGDPQFRFVNVSNELVQGKNVVEIDVWNGVFQNEASNVPNPMALRVEWYAFGRQDAAVNRAGGSRQSSSAN